MTTLITFPDIGPGGAPRSTAGNLQAVLDHLGVTVRAGDHPAEIAFQFSGPDADALNRKEPIFQFAWVKGEARKLGMPTPYMADRMLEIVTAASS